MLSVAFHMRERPDLAVLAVRLFFFSWYGDHRDLHSFPTRRSSDLHRNFLGRRSMKYILSIDQGTTSTRAIIFDKDSNMLAVASEEITQYYPNPGWVEHNPNEIWVKIGRAHV